MTKRTLREQVAWLEVELEVLRRLMDRERDAYNRGLIAAFNNGASWACTQWRKALDDDEMVRKVEGSEEVGDEPEPRGGEVRAPQDAGGQPTRER